LLVIFGCWLSLAGPAFTPAQNVATTLNPNDPTKAITGIAVDPSQNYVYVTQGDGNLTIINAATNQVVSSSAPSTNGAAAMATYLNNVFVVNSTTNNVSAYFPADPSGPNGAPFQQTFGDSNAVTPTSIVVSPSGTGKLFVSNSGSNNVSVFTLNNSGNWQQVATLGVGANPQAMAINQVTQKVYVADLGDAKVWIIDASSNSVITSVNVGSSPRSIAIDEATNKIYVPGFATNDLTVIDGATNTTQTITGFGTGPGAVAVNPLTNQIFVADIGSPGVPGSLTVVNGANNTYSNAFVSSGSGSSQAAVVVDPQTNIAYVSISSGNLTAVNGTTLAVTDLTTGAGGNSAVALNPVTHKVYTAAVNAGSNVLSVVDGAANASNTLTAQTQPWSIAVNPATNKIYVANYGANNVSVIDGTANTITATVTTGTNPDALAVDPSQNLIYAANFSSASVTIIDGSTNNTHTQPIGTTASPDSLSVNPVLGQVYGAASGQSVTFAFQSSFTPAFSSFGGSNPRPIATATNPATGMDYTLYGSGTMDINDGAAPHTFNTGVCSAGPSTPTSLAVNPQTNTVFVTCAGAEVDAIQGGSGFFPGNETPIQDPNAIDPVAVAVNPTTNQIYVANGGNATGNGSLTIIDGSTNNFVNLPITGNPVAVGFNVATGKVYVQTQTGTQSSSIVVIDGISQTILTTITAAGTSNITSQIAADPINGTIFAANRLSNSITTITENATTADGLATAVQPFSGNTTNTTTPTFTFTTSNSLDGAGPYVVYYQIDSQTGFWNYAGNTASNTFSGTPGNPISPGFHVVYAYAVNGGETGAYSSGGSLGNQQNPQIGAVTSYGFLVAPPIANVPYYPLDFGTTSVNVATAAQQPILINDGGAPMNFSYAIGGTNGSDFREVAPTNSVTLCNSLGGVLPAGTYCVVNVVFQPASTGSKSATITFTDNSLGSSGSTQTVALTGTAQAGSVQLTVNFSGNGTGTVSDGTVTCNSPGPCNQSYSSGATVTLTATPTAGSIFYGWTGACTGSGPCNLTMNSSQSVTAQFTTSAPSSCLQTDTIWVGGASGNWSVPSNWNTDAIPATGAHVCINNAKSPVSSVTLDVSANIGGLTIDPGNTLTVGNNQELVVSGTISNAGQIIVYSNNANTFLTFSGAVTLTGGGTLTLNQVIGNGQPILRNANSGSLTNVNNTIQGAGQFGNNGLLITNQAAGVINANNATLALLLNGGTVTNQGLIEATAGATLSVSVGVVNKNGTIRATGTNSVVQFLGGTDIQGGTITGTAGGLIGSFSTITLDGTTTNQGAITLTGTYTVTNNSETVISGTIINTGLISVLSNNANTFLTVNGPVTLTGGGTVTLSQAIGNGQPIVRNTNNGALTNVNNLIQGSGQFGNNGLVITNQASGVINANGPFSLQFNNGSVTNLGMVEATAGGTLTVNVIVVNKGATMLATGTGSAIQLLGGADIEGGTITSAAGAYLGSMSSVTLDGSTLGMLTINGIFTVSNNEEVVLLGTINNTGLISVISNNANTFITFSSTVTLTGGGTVTLSQAISNGQPILRNVDNGALINVNNLIQGSGQIGNNDLPITNQSGGVIDANGTFPLQLNNGTVTNLGLLEATSGGTLTVNVLVINKTSTILSTGAGSAIQLLGGADIQGGTITSAAGAYFGSMSSVTLDGSTQGTLTISGTFTVSNNQELVLLGTINNTGLISVLSNNANTFITFSGPVTLTGSGTVTLTQAISNGQPILRNIGNGAVTNVNNLIQGSGQIGNNGLLITNQAGGVINANGAFPLQFNSGTVTNLGLAEATAGGTLQVYVTVVNKGGTLLATGSTSAVQFDGGSDIQGGTISSASGAYLGCMNTTTLDGSTAQGAVTITGTYTVSNGEETVLLGTINNTGLISVLSDNANTFLTFNAAVTLTGNGTITMSQAISNGQPILRNIGNGAVTNVNNLIQGSGQLGNNGLVVINGPAGTISANGAYPLNLTSATFTNQGLFVDDGPSNPGVVTTTGYTQASTGRFEVAIGGLGGPAAGSQYSQLQNTGTATLAGELDVVLIDGFVPSVGNSFTIITSGSIVGQFTTINSSALPIGMVWSATYNATSVVLTASASTGGSSTLTITGLGTGTGTITDDLGLINCTSTAGTLSGTCSASYTVGSVANLTATPASGSTFSGWSACSGTSECSVPLNSNQTVSATFVPAGTTSFTLTVSLIGTGNGTVTDTSEQISCTDTAGVISGSCSGSYAPGTVVNLTATPAQPATFGGWSGPCTGTGTCSVTLSTSQTVTASFVPPPQIITLPFPVGTNVTEMATYDCPSNPNPTPTNPCLDPNAHALSLNVGQVTTPFTLTVQVNEVPPNVADGVCPAGDTPTQDFDCRFKSFFTYQTLPNGNTIVPLCYPYANGNCVHYTVYYQTPGTEPDPSWYTGPVNWEVTFNNDTFVPPAPYAGSTPRLYDDPDGYVLPNSPYGTNCSTAMEIGNPGTATSPAIYCQFVFDITTFYDPNKKVDAGIGGKTKVFNDVVVAIPPATAGFVTVTSTPDAATVTAGSPIGFTISIVNSSAATANNATLTDPLPSGTGVNWSISPAYSGPGTCSITGAVGAQVLSCSFGNVATSASFSIHIVSPSSSVGAITNAATVTSTDQQVLSIASITVQGVTAAFSGLTPSQSIPAGTSAIALGGIIGTGNSFPTPGESVSVTIDGITQGANIGKNGVFSLSFPTAAIPSSATAYPITYSFPGDSTFGPATDNSTALTVTPVTANFTLTVTLIGTGNGSVFDSTQQISCTDTAGVTSGSCSGTYPAGTLVTLTESPVQPSTFGGYSGACTGTQGCSVTMNSSQSVTASFIPPPQTINLSFPVGTNVTEMATYDCPSNPNPTPTNPCLDPNAHALSLNVGQVTTPFTLTVLASEVPPSVANGDCPSGDTPTQDFDCRFKSFFTYQTLPNGDAIVPLCYPYANGNCVHYTVYYQTPGTEPNPSWYTGPVNWEVTFNNDTFVPPAPYAGSTPRLYDDPDGYVLPNSPYGTNCSTPMLIGNPGTPTSPAIYCQFVFDITTFYDPNKKVDAGIGGKTKVFNDVVVAIPPATAGFVTVTSTPDAATVTAGSPIGFTISIVNSSAATATNATLSDPLPSGTNINWSISPAYSGPGTCSITGAVGAQVLNCSFGNVAASASFSLHALSASSSAGNFINQSTVTATNQQVLSIANIIVQSLPTPVFTGLTPSQSIVAGTSSITLYGTLASGSIFPATGEKVTITINAVTQQASITTNGAFTTSFPTATIPASATPYVITYSYSGDAKLGPASNTSTTLTVTAANQTITFGTLPASAAYDTTFPVSAKASSGLPVTIMASGACSLSGSTVTMTSGTGTCTLMASQSGNGQYNPVSLTKTVAATKANSSTAITANSPNPSTVSQPVTVSFTVTGVTKPTGSVKVTASTGETCTGTLTAGAGSCALIFTTTGPRTITASYGGDSNFNPSNSNPVNQTVNSSSSSTLTISPTSIDFGQVPVGSVAAKLITLTNSGTTSIKISSIAIGRTGTDLDDFFALPLCPSSLAPGKSCTVFLSFLGDNDQLGVTNASLVITDSAAGSPQTVPLKATTINPKASLNPTKLSFSPQKVGTTSAIKSVTLTSTGTTPLILNSITSSGDFSIAGTTTCIAGLSLAPTKTCRIDVTFSPKTKGQRNGEITVKDNTAQGQQQVSLSGQGD
jgi:YVTN family beta-propeller protein